MRISKALRLLIIISFLILVNLVVVFPLFQGEYDRNIASIGIAHILNAEYVWRFLGWNPFWYGGFPNHLIYPLLAPLLLGGIQKIFSFLTMAQVYRIVTGIAYVLIPVGIFFLGRYLTKRSLVGFLAALIFAFAPSANYFLIPTLRDFGEAIHFAPWQLSVLLDFGEGPHIIDLAIVPFAVIAYFKLLRRPNFFRFLLTGFLIAVVTLINLFSAYAMAYFLLVIFFSEIILGKFRQKLYISLLLIPLVYGLMAFAYDISMIKSLTASGYIHPENVFHLPPLTTAFIFVIFFLPLGLYFLYEVFRKKRSWQVYLVLGSWFSIFWIIPYLLYGPGILFGSQPNRYMPELNLVAALILGFLLVKIYDFAKEKLGRPAVPVVLGLYFAGLLFVSRDYLKNSWEITLPHPDIKSTAEYKIARWLEENASYERGERAYLTGSPAFFLNEFADVLQIRGDEDNAQASPWWADIAFMVNKNEDGGLGAGWLTTYNVRYVVVDKSAVTPYKDWNFSEKFDGLLPPVTNIDGFVIYELPSGNMIEAVDVARIEKLKPFSHPAKPVLDEKGLAQYLAVTQPLPVEINYLYKYREDPDHVFVQVKNAKENTGILFKSTFNPGWKAKVKPEVGEERVVEVKSVGPDLMLIKPGMSGDYTVGLSYNRPLVEYLGYATTFITLIVVALLVLVKRNFPLIPD